MKEMQRLAALHESGLLDAQDSESFDRITRLAAKSLGAPIALVTLVDADRQVFMSAFGLDLRETAREHSFCAHAIDQGDLMVVPDARTDARFTANPLVTGDPNIVFYAGAPLVTKDGHALGALCVIDTEPRDEFDGDSRQILNDLAASVMQEIERRRHDQEVERLTLVADELKHRMGNVYALVSALVSRLDKTVEDKDAFVKRLREKISALARAQALLASNHWRQASISELVTAVLDPLCSDAARSRIALAGDEAIALSPQGAFMLTLVLGELGTNAMKHGALSDEAGTVTLSWRFEGDRAVIDWREFLPEARPTSGDIGDGFGSKILRQIAPLDLKGRAEWTLREDGFHYVLTAERARLCTAAEEAGESAVAE